MPKEIVSWVIIAWSVYDNHVIWLCSQCSIHADSWEWVLLKMDVRGL